MDTESARVAYWMRRAEKAEAEVEKLRAALKPLADVRGLDGEFGEPVVAVVSLDVCRAAREALKETT